jgi:hypothetical protein
MFRSVYADGTLLLRWLDEYSISDLRILISGMFLPISEIFGGAGAQKGAVVAKICGTIYESMLI